MTSRSGDSLHEPTMSERHIVALGGGGSSGESDRLWTSTSSTYRVVSSRADAEAYYVEAEAGEAVEKELIPDLLD